MEYSIYNIKIDGKVRYIGMTKNPKTRERQHIRLYEKGDTKYLYEMIRQRGIIKEIKIEVIKSFSKKSDAAKYEALLILQDFFNKKQLWQSYPTSIRYW